MLNYLDKVAEKLEKRLSEHSGEDKREREKQKEQHFYKENFLKNMLLMGGMSKAEFYGGCERYRVKIKADGIYIITIYIRDWEGIVERYRDSNLSVFFQAVDHMMEETFRGYEEWEGFYTEPFCYHILFTYSKEKSALAAEQCIRQIIHNITYHFERILDIEMVMAVYRNIYPIEELNKGYQQSKLLLEQSFFWPQKKLFWNGIQHTCQAADPRELKKRLEDARQEDSMTVILEKYIDDHKDGLIDRKEFLDIVQNHRSQLARQYGTDMACNPNTYESISLLLKDIRQAEREIELEKGTEDYSFLVKQAVSLIKKEFTAKITLEGIAERLGISPGYFSRIFSSETQETFSNYVIRKRIEYAQELITTTNLKFYEIAEMSGFGSSVHFNNTFKKLCQVTPNQYRKEH